MSILDRDALEQSPLADLHTIASELSIDSFRRMRKADLIDAILARQSGEEPTIEDALPAEDAATATEDDAPAADAPIKDEEQEGSSRRGRWRRGGRGRGKEDEDDATDTAPRSDTAGASAEPAPEEEPEATAEKRKPSGRSASEQSRAEPERVEGVVELLPGGSGFVRVNPPDPSDDDVYISSAQVKRCELVTGDRISGPRRAPRRSERFASLVRVDEVNGRPAEELADSIRFEDRPIAFPDQRIGLPGGDPLLEAIERAAPIGRGSRVTIFGPAAAGKSETLRRLSGALSSGNDLQVWVALTGVRPEELAEWQQGDSAPAISLSFAASADTQSQALEGVVEQVRRLVARGADAVILIDTLDGVTPAVARKAMASARNVVDGGSLTVIATATEALGGETTLIALDSFSRAPAVDESRSWTIRRDRLG